MQLSLSKLNFLPALLTRLTLAMVFVESGWGKLHHIEKVTEYFDSLGIPFAHIQAPVVASFEFGCGILILLGLFTRWASIPLMVIMAVAIRTALFDKVSDFSALTGLSEYLYIVLLVWLIVYGAGLLSLDRLLTKRTFFRKKT